MYDQDKLISIIKESQGDNSLNEFARLSGVDSAYLSRIINKKRNNPPSPKILEKLSKASKGKYSYGELLQICGYLNEPNTALYDFANENDKEIINNTIFFALKNNLSNQDIYNNPFISAQLNKLEKMSKNQALNQIKIYLQQSELIYGTNLTINSNAFPITDIPLKVPIVGKISAGLPILATENLEGYEFAPSSYIKEGFTYFYLKVQGDSMNQKFNSGDIVLVQQQPTLENNEIGVILIDGQDATVKKYRKENELVILEPMSTNIDHHAQIYNPKEISIKIVGKVVSYQGKV